MVVPSARRASSLEPRASSAVDTCTSPPLRRLGHPTGQKRLRRLERISCSLSLLPLCGSRNVNCFVFLSMDARTRLLPLHLGLRLLPSPSARKTGPCPIRVAGREGLIEARLRGESRARPRVHRSPARLQGAIVLSRLGGSSGSSNDSKRRGPRRIGRRQQGGKPRRRRRRRRLRRHKEAVPPGLVPGRDDSRGGEVSLRFVCRPGRRRRGCPCPGIPPSGREWQRRGGVEQDPGRCLFVGEN